MTQYEFVKNKPLPDKLPIATPLTFPFIGENIVLTKKGNESWSVLEGKTKNGEDWMQTLTKEVAKKAGIYISHISVIGYLHAKGFKNTSHSKSPDESVLPVTVSFVQSVDANWKQQKRCGREALKRNKAKEVLKEGNDNQQLLTAFASAIEYFDNENYNYNFTYVKNSGDAFDNIPTTQAMVFLQDSESERFIVVRDEDESFFSLPGGGCRIDELDTDCARREVMEEAQVNVKNLELLGTVLVDVNKDGEVLSRSKHVRFIGEATRLDKFIPNKNGFETVERKLIASSELKKEVKLLQNKTGGKILQHIKQEI